MMPLLCFILQILIDFISVLRCSGTIYIFKLLKFVVSCFKLVARQDRNILNKSINSKPKFNCALLLVKVLWSACWKEKYGFGEQYVKCGMTAHCQELGKWEQTIPGRLA